MFKIVQKNNKNIVYAVGFFIIERAEKWIENYNPQMYTDKTIKKEDLEIVTYK